MHPKTDKSLGEVGDFGDLGHSKPQIVILGGAQSEAIAAGLPNTERRIITVECTNPLSLRRKPRSSESPSGRSIAPIRRLRKSTSSAHDPSSPSAVSRPHPLDLDGEPRRQCDVVRRAGQKRGPGLLRGEVQARRNAGAVETEIRSLGSRIAHRASMSELPSVLPLSTAMISKSRKLCAARLAKASSR